MAKSHDNEMRAHRTPRLSGPVLALLYLLACLLPLVLAAGRSVAPLDAWERAAAGLGLVALAGLAIQFVTSGRFSIVSGRLGIDRVMAFHKIAAWWLLLAVLLHPLLYVLPTWADNPALGTERLVAYLTLPHYRSGVIACCALALLIAGAAVRSWLPWSYELWRGSHVVLGLIAVGAGLHHAVTVGRFSALGTVHWVWWATGLSVTAVIAILYGWRWLKLHWWPWRLQSVTKLADRMWELDIQPANATPALPYRAGQFVWMTVGGRRFPLFDHPFSIADSPMRPGLSLIVKEAGDFTRQVGTLAPGTAVGVDGPYGEFVLEPRAAGSILLLAGGVGVAPIMGILRDLVARADARPVRLAYAVGRPENFACLPEIEAARQTLDLHVLLLSEEQTGGWQGEVGRLNRERLRDLMRGLLPEQTVALLCGPGPMVTAVSDMLLDLGLPMKNVVYERFDYASGSVSRHERRRAIQSVMIGASLAAAVAVFALLPS
jgi:predicted ferric reductase